MLCMSPFAKLHKRALDRVGEHVYFMAVGCSVYFVLFLVMVFGGELPRTRHTGKAETTNNRSTPRHQGPVSPNYVKLREATSNPT